MSAEVQQDLPSFATTGRATSTIPVRIGYRIVELFSDGLYASPNKAIEELVSNSFDAGATRVQVMMSPDRGTEDAIIAVLDDGVSMDEAGLKQHWLIGESNKRAAGMVPPRGRKQIGKFGIGKLATFVLGHHLTHICKTNGRFYAATMDYTKIRQASAGLAAEQEITLPLRELSAAEVQQVIPPMVLSTTNIELFGKKAAPTWTLALMSGLKPMAAQIRKRDLTWVLRTAMPLRDDFTLYLDREVLAPSKLATKPLRRWVLGSDLKQLPKPAPDDLEPTTDVTAPEPERYGLTHPSLGRITGYAEIYDDVLTGGKSDELGHSNGFFIYVHGRLVNTTDERFGIDPDTLRHGTFARFRAVLHIDRLDEDLRSTRETVREGSNTTVARNVAHGIFNVARSALQQADEEAKPGTRSRTRIGQTPGSLTRRPLVSLVRQALKGDLDLRYVHIPDGIVKEKLEEYVEAFRVRSEGEGGLVKEVEYETVSSDAGIALYDVQTGTLKINTLHPFVVANRDEYEKGDTLTLLSMAEVLTEAYLHEVGIKPGDIADVLKMRDELLRYFARSDKKTAGSIAQALEDAAHDQSGLEAAVVAAFDSMGFNAVGIGGSGEPDGLATARLGAADGQKRRYKVSLEAKSKEKEGAKVSSRTVHVSGVARHREAHGCDHCVVVGQDFQLGSGADEGAVIEEARADKKNTGRTVTLVRIRDMARLVRLVPLKGISLERVRGLFSDCITPEEAHAWIEQLANEKPEKAPFKKILETVWSLQDEQPDEPIEFSALRVALRKDHNIDMSKTLLSEICHAVARIAPEYVVVRQNSSTIELNQRPDKILEAAGAALQHYPDEDKKKSIFKV